MILPETWRADDGPDFYEDLRESLHVTGGFAPLARGERVTTGVGGSSWQPRLAHFVGERGLYFYEHRSLTKEQLATRAGVDYFEKGTWGLGLLTRVWGGKNIICFFLRLSPPGGGDGCVAA